VLGVTNIGAAPTQGIIPVQLPTENPSASLPVDCIYRTQTQGGWGARPHGNNPGTYLHANFSSAFPGGLVIGCATGFIITLTSAQAVTDFLPSGGKPSALTASLTNPVRFQNTLAGQIAALSLSVGFDQYDAGFGASSFPLADAVIASGTFAGWTVQQVLDEANAVLGGCSSSYSASAINGILTQINQSFVGGIPRNTTLFECEQDTCPVLAFDIQAGCLGEPVYIANNSTGVDAGATYYLDVFNDGTIDLSANASDLPDDSLVSIPFAGTFDFAVIVVNGNGCSDTLVSQLVIDSCMFSEKKGIGIAEGNSPPRVYPNPVRQGAILEFYLKNEDSVTIRLYDICGRTIMTVLENTVQKSGYHQQAITFPAELAPGFYFMTIESEGERMNVKVAK